ncbi:hypothetical protein CYMTET_22793 [Cymbomonas tetramitiformis]|uniref:Ankyrin repeat protein n=1 Tax=Cymbomonas tetramitiformis TaxID=36881 RepID=A0AAE0FZH7_9CHLO|nr:hypothetical protein CYMTET_22793 [Cymbomonas tetramitiformis]
MQHKKGYSADFRSTEFLRDCTKGDVIAVARHLAQRGTDVEEMFRYGPDSEKRHEWRDFIGKRAVHLCVFGCVFHNRLPEPGDNLGVLRLLLDHGADINSVAYDKESNKSCTALAL